MRQKIIFVIVSMAGGGAERVIAILANQFVKRNMDVAIMMTAGDEVAYELDSRIELVPIGKTSGGSMIARGKRIYNMRKYFKKNKHATIISFGPGTSFFAVVADMFLKNKMIISERNDPKACEYPFLRNLVYSRADYMVYQTYMAMKEFPGRLQKNAAVIENPVSKKLPHIFMEETKKKVVAVGRLEKQKNHKLLLEAFADFHNIYPQYKLHIYGKGELEKQLKEKTVELGIKECVVWEGFSKQVTEEIKDAQMYVLPSDYEGISNSLLEAMAMGIPVISTDCPIGGSAMCIRHRENGILVPVGDREAIVSAMCELAESKELRNQISEQAYKIREKYSEENIVKRWLEIVEMIGDN